MQDEFCEPDVPPYPGYGTGTFSSCAGLDHDTISGMKDQDLLSRIQTTPEILEGKPAVRGTRLSVAFILNLLAHGASMEEILEEYEELEREDISACLLFAARALEGSTPKPPSILDLFGSIDYDPDYDYKKQRAKR